MAAMEKNPERRVMAGSVRSATSASEDFLDPEAAVSAVQVGVAGPLLGTGADFARGGLAEAFCPCHGLDGRVIRAAGVGSVVLVKLVHWISLVVEIIMVGIS